MKELRMMAGGDSVDIDRLTAAPAHVRAGDIFYGAGSDEEQIGTLPDRSQAGGLTIDGMPLHLADDSFTSLCSDGVNRIVLAPPRGEWPGGADAYTGVSPDMLGIVAEHIANGRSICGVPGSYGADGNVAAKDIREGLIAYGKNGKVTGSAVDCGNVSKTLKCGESYTIKEGIYGAGKVIAADLKSQTGVDSGKTAAAAAQILNGYQAWVLGAKVSGSMPDNTGVGTNGTVPGISKANKTIPTREGTGLQMQTDTSGTSRISICPPKGYYQGSGGSYVNRPASDFGTAERSEVLKDKTFTSTAGVKKAGTMKNITADATITHATGNATKVVLGDAAYQSKNSDGTDRVEIRYNSTDGFITKNTLFAVALSTMASALGITAAKVRKGQTVCGVTGSWYGNKACINAVAYRGFGINSADWQPSEEKTFTMPENGTVYYGGCSACASSSRNITLEIYQNNTLKDSRNMTNSDSWAVRGTMFDKSFTANKGDVIKVKATATAGTHGIASIQAVIVY